MRTVTILEGREYRIESIGNGTFTALIHKPTGKRAFFQGEDSGFFIDAVDAAENAFPAYSADQIGAHLWCDHEYGSVAEHTRVFAWGPYSRLSDKRTIIPRGDEAGVL
jgi:hypothetical protein